MRPSFRIGLGFVLGCILSFFAFALTGAGHGTYTPVVANAPMLIFIPGVGILAAVFGTPVLWAAYFLLIPKIKSGIARLLAVMLVALVHLGSGAGMALQDSYLQRTFKSQPWPIVFYFGFLIVAVVILGLLARPGTINQLNNED
jgi:hypothetical protein